MFKNRRLLLIKGIFLVLFGITALVLPSLGLLVFLWYLAVLFMILGGFLLFGSFEHIHTNKHWFLWGIEGLLDILIGIAIVINPEISLQLLMLLIAIWAIIKAIMHIIHVIHIKKHGIVFVFNALILFLFAYLLLFHPRAGAVAMTYVLGIFAIIFGIALAYLGTRLKQIEPNKGILIAEIEQIESQDSIKNSTKNNTKTKRGTKKPANKKGSSSRTKNKHMNSTKNSKKNSSKSKSSR